MLAQSYLVHGGEPLQTEEIISSIKHQAEKEGYNRHVVFELNTQFEWEELLNKCRNLDLFAERTLMELRLPGENVSKQGNLALDSVLHEQDGNFCIIIRAAKLKPQILNSNWARHIQKHGKICLAKPIPTNQWPAWIAKRLTQKGFNPSNEVITCIAKCYEGNLPAAVQCINKLTAVLPQGTIKLAQVAPFIDRSSHFSIFELSTAALEGDNERTFSIFNNLKTDGIDPILVLWAATKEIRTLLLLKQEMQAGASLEPAAQKLGIWRDNIPKIKLALQRLSTQKLEQLLHLAKITDTTIKGMQPGDAWEVLLSMYLTLAGNKILTMEDLYI
jgi:DNA polymerase-3 subunit delta